MGMVVVEEGSLFFLFILTHFNDIKSIREVKEEKGGREEKK